MKLLTGPEKVTQTSTPSPVATIKPQGRNRKGSGSLRLTKGAYYFRFTDATGKRTERACKTSNYDEAVKVANGFLSEKATVRAAILTNQPSGPLVSELLSNYLRASERKAEYRAQADEDFDPAVALSGLRGVIKRLDAKLGNLSAEHLTTAEIDIYRRVREEDEGVLFSTVNHELRYLRAALNQGMTAAPPKISHVPRMWMPSEESRVREGFIERHLHYQQFGDALPDSMKAIFVCGFHTGARSGELKKLRWPMVDFERRIIVVRAKTAKNKRGRYLPIWGDMLEVLQWQKRIRDRECPDCPWVFFWHMNTNAPVITGSKLGSIDKQFKRAVTALGMPDVIFHDLRRSAIKYATQEADIDQPTVKLMSGHKSDAVFNRYNITGAREIVKMGAQLDTYLSKSGGCRGLHLVEFTESEPA